eukprot:307173-Chlamydomonas_euryale.AAC.3
MPRRLPPSGALAAAAEAAALKPPPPPPRAHASAAVPVSDARWMICAIWASTLGGSFIRQVLQLAVPPAAPSSSRYDCGTEAE